MVYSKNSFNFSPLAPVFRNSSLQGSTLIPGSNSSYFDPNGDIVVIANKPQTAVPDVSIDNIMTLSDSATIPLGTSYLPAGSPVNKTSLDKMPDSSLNNGLGFNMGTAQLALGGLQTIGSLWSAFQANKMAKKQFKYTKEVTDTNLNNSIKSYNTALNDRINSRAVVNGLNPQQVQSYLTANSLSRAGTKPTPSLGG